MRKVDDGVERKGDRADQQRFSRHAQQHCARGANKKEGDGNFKGRRGGVWPRHGKADGDGSGHSQRERCRVRSSQFADQPVVRGDIAASHLPHI